MQTHALSVAIFILHSPWFPEQDARAASTPTTSVQDVAPSSGAAAPKGTSPERTPHKSTKRVTMLSVDEESIHTSILLQTRVMYRYLAYRNLCLEEMAELKIKYIHKNDDE